MKPEAGLSGGQIERLDQGNHALTGQRLFKTKAGRRPMKGDSTFTNKMLPWRYRYAVKRTSMDPVTAALSSFGRLTKKKFFATI
jgi:hypothetical protein